MTQDFVTTLLLQLWLFVFVLPVAAVCKVYQMTNFRVKYSAGENKTANVYIYRFLRKKEHYCKYEFKKALDEKWFYTWELNSLKARICCFVTGFSVLLITWSLSYGEKPNVAIYLISALFWGVIAFVTLITDPIEAYVALQIDQRKKRCNKEDEERGFASLKKVIRAFWRAIENGSEEEAALCFYTKSSPDEIVYEKVPAEVYKLIEIVKRSYESGIIIDYKMSLIGTYIPAIDYFEIADVEEGHYSYIEVSVAYSDTEANYEIEGEYRIDTIRLNKKWYIYDIHRIDEDEIRQKNQREGIDEG